MQRKKLNDNKKSILHLEDMFSKQQNIFLMNVTYVILSLCLARDKKNRSNAKLKQNGAYRHHETITVPCLISIQIWDWQSCFKNSFLQHSVIEFKS